MLRWWCNNHIEDNIDEDDDNDYQDSDAVNEDDDDDEDYDNKDVDDIDGKNLTVVYIFPDRCWFRLLYVDVPNIGFHPISWSCYENIRSNSFGFFHDKTDRQPFFWL